MGSAVGFEQILDERLAFTTLDENENCACLLFMRGLI